jgi:hypothetical protein
MSTVRNSLLRAAALVCFTLRISPTRVKSDYRTVRGESENQNARQEREAAPSGSERRHTWPLVGSTQEDPFEDSAVARKDKGKAEPSLARAGSG